MKQFFLLQLLKLLRFFKGGLNVYLMKQATLSARVEKNGKWSDSTVLNKKSKLLRKIIK